MSGLRASVGAALALAATLASAQATSPSIEERLQQLEVEQAAMKQQLADRDKEIEELRRVLQAQQAQGSAATAPPVAVTPPTQAPVGAAGSAVPPPQPATTDMYQVAGQPPPGATDPEPREETWGVYDPGKGFLVGRKPFGELDISAYALGRYIDQKDADGVYTDHLGNVHKVDDRNDIFSHRIMVWLMGWVGDPKFVYTITLWTVNTTDQQAIFANLGYQFSPKFSLYAGMVGNPGSRSLVGSHPYWLGNDRVMADEFFRPYFGSGIYANGEILPGLWYQAVVSNNNSALGVKASQLDRKMTTGATMWWMPTTHEFGPRGGYGDWEWHEELATRFGFGFVDSPEQSFRDSAGNPQNTTLRLADSLNLFDSGSLAPGVTIKNADYRVLSVDAGMKYKGFFLQAEYYQRWLDNFDADGPLPVTEIRDSGWYLQGAFYPIPRVLELYAATSQIYGDSDAGFGNATEYLIGGNWYPFNTRNHRLNVQLMDINHSPVSSVFGYYTGGLDGWTLAAAFSIFF